VLLIWASKHLWANMFVFLSISLQTE
jgi:hypothetical protein